MFKKYKHWNLRYAKNKIGVFLYQRNSLLPWLTKETNDFLNNYLKTTDKGLEFGSGRSTVWLSDKVEKLTSIEHNIEWYKKVNDIISEKNITNVEYSLIPEQMPFKEEDYDVKYSNVIKKIEDLSLDFVLIDGIYRSSCAFKCIEKLKPGGIIIVDNIERYLRYETWSPEKLSSELPLTITWQKFYDCVKNWRFYWTTSGVTDTVIFFKPY